MVVLVFVCIYDEQKMLKFIQLIEKDAESAKSLYL